MVTISDRQRTDRNRVYAVYIPELTQTFAVFDTDKHTYPYHIAQFPLAITNRCGVECSVYCSKTVYTAVNIWSATRGQTGNNIRGADELVVCGGVGWS